MDEVARPEHSRDAEALVLLLLLLPSGEKVVSLQELEAKSEHERTH